MQHKHPNSAISMLIEKLKPVDSSEFAELAPGRITAEDIQADRDSPAADVSAMDGFAFRIAELEEHGQLPVQGECKAGCPPVPLQPRTASRIYTGAIVPQGADLVLKREDASESESVLKLKKPTQQLTTGDNIRKAGENAKQGNLVLAAGSCINSANAATIANFGPSKIKLVRPLRVAIVTTGDEVGKFETSSPDPWQLRNSNLNSLLTFCAGQPWIRIASHTHCTDKKQTIIDNFQNGLSNADAVLVTGGVSVGDYDFVPDAIGKVGAEILFHGLPIRPGKPILGAATQEGKLILGLPGNPVSALIGCCRIGMPVLRYLAGFKEWTPRRPLIRLATPDTKTIPLTWMRLVSLNEKGDAELCPSLGSGDLVSLGQSTGFIEIPPNECGSGPWPYFAWA
ncbi:molybdopterin molybdotransferase MoeA [bacterium]|nr:molybdopterin molybdotransferase MoeA [bacterium]